jgi:hypothetical protein
MSLCSGAAEDGHPVVCVASCVSRMQPAVRSRAHVDIDTDNDIVHQQMPPGNLTQPLILAICGLGADDF